MGKITKVQTKNHDEAMRLINSGSSLSDDQIEFCFENYNPMAEHNVGKGGIFFTPGGLARDLSVMANTNGTVVDLCAGIGILSYYMSLYEKPKRHVAIEINPEFVRIGQILLPDVEWYCANALDLKFISSIGSFDCAISNPPYGYLPGLKDVKWTKSTGPIQWRIIEVAIRIARSATFILLDTMGDHDHTQGYEPRKYPERMSYLKCFPEVRIIDTAVDCDIYNDEWDGASPKVRLYDIDCDDYGYLPVGFGDLVFQQGLL